MLPLDGFKKQWVLGRYSGSNSSPIVKINDKGEFFLKFCSEKKLKIKNTKRIHRGSWLHQLTGLVKRLGNISLSLLHLAGHIENIFHF